MDSSIPVIVGIVAAVLGALGGIAAILKVQSDNSNSVAEGAKAVSDGAKTVVDLMSDRMDESEAHAALNTTRIENLEEYVSHFDSWADRLLSILDRAVSMLPDAMREQYESETNNLRETRPKRVGKGSVVVTTTTTTATSPPVK